MCAILGALLVVNNDKEVFKANLELALLMGNAVKRGRDGFGYSIELEGGSVIQHKSNECFVAHGIDEDKLIPKGYVGVVRFVSNFRAEPTTEYVKEKSLDDQQPYSLGSWTVVHNGTIANDTQIKNKCIENEIALLPTKVDSARIAENLCYHSDGEHSSYAFAETISELVGSYAIIATISRQEKCLYLATNYRPIWAYQNESGVFFASCESYFTFSDQSFNRPFMLNPYSIYSAMVVGSHFKLYKNHTTISTTSNKSLVVCSGGLDSVVSAKKMQADGHEITLIHFLYGSRAEGPEVKAVKEVAECLGCELVLFPLNVYDKSDSPLLQEVANIAESEKGAEYAHEWVPARNLVLLSVATAYAEAKGFGNIVLGNNLEEAGAYPDNEPEFINLFNRTLKLAVGDGKSVSVLMPVGNLMKHEIVALGKQINAPMDKTWSCYHSRELHCGKCGPCYMRKTAFDINNLPEVIEYEV